MRDLLRSLRGSRRNRILSKSFDCSVAHESKLRQIKFSSSYKHRLLLCLLVWMVRARFFSDTWADVSR
jgi:hypothetical protein